MIGPQLADHLSMSSITNAFVPQKQFVIAVVSMEASSPRAMRTAIVLGVLAVALAAFFLGRAFPSKSSIVELVEKNRVEIADVRQALGELTKELRVYAKTEQADSNPKSNPTGPDAKLARILVTNSAKEKQQLTEARLTAAKENKNLTAENVHLIASDLQAMNAILTSPEHLEPALLDQVEKERDRLLDLLKVQIPPLVKAVDEQAIKEQESKEALGLWAKGGALLGYFPASNIPKEAQAIQKMVTEHETVRTRLALLQKQRYNVWAGNSIKKAWLDFSDPDVPSAKAKLETCKRFLGPIETSQLEPIMMELYRDFLEAIKKKVSGEEYRDLATSLANYPNRRLPGEKEFSASAKESSK
jgi:hypothetical protein